MNDRTAGPVIGVLALICIALVVSVAVPLSTSTPHAANPADERFAVGDVDEYAVEGSIVVDGQTKLQFEGVVTADGERHYYVEDGGVRSERYQAAPDGDAYERMTVGEEEVDRRIEGIERDDDRELLRENRSEDGATLVVVEREPGDLADEISGSASVFTNSLHAAGYERIEAAGEGRVYEPRDGWYGETDTYRITDSTGEVRIDPDAGAVDSATASWEVSSPADTYAHYLAATLVGDDPTTHEITYEFERDSGDVTAPEWVEDARREG